MRAFFARRPLRFISTQQHVEMVYHPCRKPSRWCSHSTTKTTIINNTDNHQEEEKKQELLKKVQLTCSALQNTLGSLLEDRQCLYRENVLDAKLTPKRQELKRLLQFNTSNVESSDVVGLTLEKLMQWRKEWLFGKEKEEEGGREIDKRDKVLEFYNAVLFSAAITSDADIRLVLDTMRDHDHLEPDDKTYIAIMLSLIVERKVSHRVKDDVGFYYFGHALKTMGESFITHEMWGALFILCTVMETAGKLIDQWWDLLLKTCEGSSSLLPYAAVHAALTWCSANRDVERVLRFFHTANSKGITAMTENGSICVIKSGGLTEKNRDKMIQMYQLKLLVKLIVTVKSIKMDGGLRNLVIKDIRRLIDADLLQSAPWGVLNDLLSGLSMPSAMQLLKFRSMHTSEGDGGIPFTLWASLLRRCAREHHIDQAESLFLFIRKRFTLTSVEKAELVEIMLRMFATLPQPDYTSAMALFLEHVVRTPQGEPRVAATSSLYALLVRAADSRSAAMMTFLEACAAGVGVSEEMLEAVVNAHRHTTVAALSRKLPHDYQASKLDGLIHIPANVDAHLRREEAMKLRGKPIVDSTGEVN
ncbi:uncharacterized protein TM35_000014440 [Trypanosoma theileri]|uniref:Uncharacterized protein n=1 Tax=Trypanosoma theileri TaxID=67003 RepID=A0A1X0P9G0_9TRYP|nr:uncharacterized protein TM35_000014440 [Trypanosoma theileri]ORC93567.1 hypothetical protein TM35_000014440 [Trypanosoma theileri]